MANNFIGVEGSCFILQLRNTCGADSGFPLFPCQNDVPFELRDALFHLEKNEDVTGDVPLDD
jgi:hypothetical protein